MQFDKSKFVILTLSSILFFSYIAVDAGINLTKSLNEPEQAVQGISDSESLVAGESINTQAQLMLNNTETGIGVMELSILNPVSISDGVLQFKIEGDLEVYDVTCAVGFVCQDMYIDSEIFALSFIRDFRMSEELLVGNVPLFQIKYNPETSGELILNSEEVKSGIASNQFTSSLISDEALFLQIGKR